MFKGSLPQEDSFFETLSPQQKQQYLQLQQQKAAAASLETQQSIEQRIAQNISSAVQLDLKQQQSQQQQQHQPQTLQIVTYDPNGITTTTRHPLQSNLVQINIPFSQIEIPAQQQSQSQQQQQPQSDPKQSVFFPRFSFSSPGLFKQKFSQAPWRKMIATRYNKHGGAPNKAPVGQFYQDYGVNDEFLNSFLPHGHVSFVNTDGSPSQLIQHNHHRNQTMPRDPFGMDSRPEFFDPFALMFGMGHDMDRFGAGHGHPFHQHQQFQNGVDEFGRPTFNHPMGMFGRDPFFGPPFGSMMMDPFSTMHGGRRGMMMDPFAQMRDGMGEASQLAEAQADRPRPFGGSSMMTFSSSSSSSSDGIVKKSSSYNSSQNFDGKPKTKSYSSSSVTRVGADGIARTEKSEEERADDGTLDGKKHKKVVSTEVEDNPAFTDRFARFRRPRDSTDEASPPVIPVAEAQRIETDFTRGDTKITHERRIGQKQHQHVTAISAPAPGAESFTQYDHVEGMNQDELDQFNEQFAQVGSKLTPEPPAPEQEPTQQNEEEQNPPAQSKKWKLW